MHETTGTTPTTLKSLALPEPLKVELAPSIEIATTYAGKTSQAATSAASGTCAQWMAEVGIADTANATELIRRESGCNPNAVNPDSGACGIGQSLPCSKMGAVNADGTSAVYPVSQMAWMQQYVLGRYGSWAAAVAWHDSHNWY